MINEYSIPTSHLYLEFFSTRDVKMSFHVYNINLNNYMYLFTLSKGSCHGNQIMEWPGDFHPTLPSLSLPFPSLSHYYAHEGAHAQCGLGQKIPT